MHPHKMTQFLFKMAKIVRIRVGTRKRIRVCALNVTYHTPKGCDTGPRRGPVYHTLWVWYHPRRGW